RSVSTPRSSNRTCGFPASGFRTKVDSCGRPREVGGRFGEADQAERLVEILVGVRSSPGSAHFVFTTQPLAQPMAGMRVHRPIGFADGAKAEVLAPSAQQSVELADHLGSFVDETTPFRQLADSLGYPCDFLPTGLGAHIDAPGSGGVASFEAIAKELETLLRHSTQAGLLFIHR